MNRVAMGMVLAIILAWAAPAPAQWFFSKKAKANPTQRVPELILTVKTDPDERKRASAAEELREYDARTFTEIVPVLADVLLHDKKQTVRSEALTSLSKIRPVSNLAGQAMEKAAAEDESLRVRWQAKTALPKYYLAGYLSRKTDPPPAKPKQTEEPPPAQPRPAQGTDTLRVQAPPPPPFPRPLPPGVATPSAPDAPPVEGPSLFPK
jgi:hypothetical protein